LITVINKRNAKYLTKHVCYVGRPSPLGNPLGNPFVLRDESQRELILDKYRHWLDVRLAISDSEQSDEIHKLSLIAANEDMELVCWCAPKLCHADVIKEKLLQMVGHS